MVQLHGPYCKLALTTHVFMGPVANSKTLPPDACASDSSASDRISSQGSETQLTST